MNHILLELKPGQQPYCARRVSANNHVASKKLELRRGSGASQSNNARLNDSASDDRLELAFPASGQVDSPAVTPLPQSNFSSASSPQHTKSNFDTSFYDSSEFSSDPFAVAPSASRSGLSARFAAQLILKIKHADERKMLQRQQKGESRSALQGFGGSSRRLSVAVMGREADVLKLVLLREE
jgi:hypothetical protein